MALTSYHAYQNDTPESTPVMREFFAWKYGYPAEECEVHPFMNLFHIRLGPCYPTRKVSAGEVLPGNIILLGEVWECVADCEGGTILTESDNLITLPEYVTVRL